MGLVIFIIGFIIFITYVFFFMFSTKQEIENKITLKDEIIAWAGLDVFEKEPLPQDHRLRFIPNALILPHIGYVTAENYSKFYLQMIENLNLCLKNKPIRIISNWDTTPRLNVNKLIVT